MRYVREGRSVVNAASAVRLVITYKLITELLANPCNPRIHSKKQIEQIAKSIATFGFLVPVLVDTKDRILAGHGRVLAAKLLGLAEIPTIRVTDLTEAQMRAFMIADNRLTENSMWDDRLLDDLLKQFSEMELDFDLDVIGFEMAEIECRIQGLAEATECNDSADALPKLGTGTPVSQPGDLWLLGPHRVLCADARVESSFQQLMEDGAANMVFTDPPYNVPIDGHVSGKGAIKHADFAMACGEMSEEEFTKFLTTTLSLAARYSCDGSLCFVCMDWRHLGELLAAGKKPFSALKNVCVWSKDRAGLGSLYRSRHELIFVFKRGTAPHTNNIQLGQFGRYRTNVWEYPSAVSFGQSGEEGNLLAVHPTVKPSALVADAILDCSRRGDIILDPFLGSGTTVIAAERTGRCGYGLEIDPTYVDVIIRRWQAFTGKTAVNSISGQTFGQREQEVKLV